MADFGTNFLKSFREGLPIGNRTYLQNQQNSIDAEKELKKRQQKIAETNKQTKAYAEAIGMPVETNELGEVTLGEAPEDYQFQKPDQSMEAILFPEMGNEYQQSYNRLVKENEPEYISYQTQWDQEQGKGVITAIDKKSNKRVTIGDDPTYKPKKTESAVISGQVELEDGTKVGKNGRRTRLMTYEDGTYKTIDLGMMRKSGSGGSDDIENEELEFELDLADVGERMDNIRAKRNTYLKGNFADPQARDAYRDGINSDFNEVALQYAKLGGVEAEAEILNIMKEAKGEIGKPMAGSMGTVSRKQFYEVKKQEITDAWMAGEWGYKDAMAILQFLNAKFNLFLDYEDAKRGSDELDIDMDDILTNMKLEK